MSGNYVIKDRESGNYYRRSLNGSPAWTAVFRDATRFATYEGALAVAEQLKPLNYCAVTSVTFQQPELFSL